MSFLDNHGLSSLWNKIQDKLATKADSSHDHTSISGTAENVTGVVGIDHGGTGNTSRPAALTALIAGGGTETDANIVAPGTYVLNTGTGSNLPSESGYYLLTVFRYDTSDLACGQIAINLGNGNLYSRDYVSGNWKEWVCCSSQKIDTILIPNGADLNNYRDKGFYASNKDDNSTAIANLPSDFDNKGAFELVVTGIDEDGVYCTQWLKSYISNKLWVRTQKNWHEPWDWTNWERIPVKNEVLTKDSEGIELGMTLPSTAGHGGYIDFHFNGSSEDYTSRLMETSKGALQTTGSFITTGYFQSFGGLWVSGRGLFVNSDVYGTSLPAAGTAGRVFFKRV